MLEPGLETSAVGQPLSAGSCLHASVLATGLWNRFYDGGAVIRGGDGALAQGARDIEGQWKGHYWCEVAIGENRFTLDITADQFGHEPARVLSYESAAGLEYRAGT